MPPIVFIKDSTLVHVRGNTGNHQAAIISVVKAQDGITRSQLINKLSENISWAGNTKQSVKSIVDSNLTKLRKNGAIGSRINQEHAIIKTFTCTTVGCQYEARNRSMLLKHLKTHAITCRQPAEDTDSEVVVKERITEAVDTKAELQASRVELQASKAELQASKAELQASKAELQASKAELQASRVELQASKAELQASRVGLQASCAQVDKAQHDLYVANEEHASLLNHFNVMADDSDKKASMIRELRQDLNGAYEAAANCDQILGFLALMIAIAYAAGIYYFLATSQLLLF
jgi:chromosome segregation ATPase